MSLNNTSPASVMRIDPATGHVETVIPATAVLPGAPGPGEIAVGYGSLWSLADDAVTRLTPGGRTLATIPAPRAVAITLGDHEVWVLSYPRSNSPAMFEPIKNTGAVREIAPNVDQVIGRPRRLAAGQPIALTTTRHSLWIADYPNTLTHLRLLTCKPHGHAHVP